MWVRNKSSVTNLNTLTPISLLVVDVTAITMPGSCSYRKLKSIKKMLVYTTAYLLICINFKLTLALPCLEK